MDVENGINWERIVPVPSSTRAEAIQMLSSTPLLRLSDEELQRLFPQGKPNGDTQANAAISRAEAEAERRERESKIEFFN
jgi:hypothetical protein